MSLKVLMVGGRRCGKTSALGATFEQIISGVASEFFTISDNTNYVTKSDGQTTEEQDVLSDKQLELQLKLEVPTTNIFLVDSGPTYFDWVYRLKLAIPDKPSLYLEMEFIDVPGEWFEAGAGKKMTASGLTVRDQIIEYVKEADVYVITVDVPMLMSESDAVAKATNSVGGIHNYLTNIKCGPKDHKMVIFTPIKCEYWVKNNEMDAVIERMKNIYATTITALQAIPNMDICILPIQTAGNIVFMERTEASLLATPGSTTGQKCCKIDEANVRLSDGEIREKKPEEILNPDPKSVACGLPRPYAWFEINFDVPEGAPFYAPRNCDQLPLHILRFYFRSTIAKYPGIIPDWAWEYIFGKITPKMLNHILNSMLNNGVIKDRVEYISYIKRNLIKEG